MYCYVARPLLSSPEEEVAHCNRLSNPKLRRHT